MPKILLFVDCKGLLQPISIDSWNRLFSFNSVAHFLFLFFQFHTRFHSSLLRKNEKTDSISPKSTSHFLYAPFISNHFLHIKILCSTLDFDHFVFTLDFTLPNILCFILNPHSVVSPRFSLTIRLFRCHLVFHFDPMLRTIQRSRLLIQSVRAITQRISNGRKNHSLMF